MALRRGHAANQVLASSFITDGSLSEDVTIPAGGVRRPASLETLREGLHTFHVSDSERLRAGLDGASARNFVQVVRESVERSGARPADIAFLAINHMKPSMRRRILATLGLREDQSLYLSETVLELLHASEPPEHEADHGEVDPGLTGGAEPLTLAAESRPA